MATDVRPDLHDDEWKAIVEFALTRIPSYLGGQRWYPAKDAGAPTVTLAAFIPVPVAGLPSAIAVWSAVVSGRAPLLLFMPIAVFADSVLAVEDPAVIGALPGAGETRLLADAFASDDFVLAFVSLMIKSGQSLPGLETGRTVAADGLQLGVVRRSRVEQSNTSIRIGDAAILKVIRKLAQGINPELEMGRFLTDVAHFAAIPAMLGWMELDGMAVSVLQAFVSNEGDGWSWILERLRGPGEEHARALAWVRKLGARTAEMHLALATPTDDPDFAAEPAVAADWRRWTSDIADMAARVSAALKSKRDELDAVARDIADRFERHSATLAQTLIGLSRDVMKTRHHGDYHLGQVLVSGDDATIVDFEGEPLRPLAERRAKNVPLRDVAGMLRSFAYAAAVAERDLPESAAVPIRHWAAGASAAYAASYFATMQHEPDTALVDFFTIEKALYEVLYELANRPTWVPIPLSSVVTLLEHAHGDTHLGTEN